MKPITNRKCRIAFAFPLVIWVLLSTVQGQTWRLNQQGDGVHEIVIGNPTLGRTDGLLLRVFPPAIGGPGTYGWTVQVYRADGKSFPADQELRLDLIQTANMQSPDVSSSTKIKLLQGSSYAEVKFLCPTWRQYAYWKISVFRDGRELTGFGNVGYQWSASSSYADSIMQNLIVLEDDSAYARYLSEFPGQLAAEFRLISTLRQWSLPVTAWNRLNSNNANATSHSSEIALASRLPENWLEYTHCRWIWIQSKSLGRLNAAQVEAIRQFVAGGGVVVVTQHDLNDLFSLQKFFASRDPLAFAQRFDVQNASFGATTLWEKWLKVDDRAFVIGGITTGLAQQQPTDVINSADFNVENAIDHPIRFVQGLGRSVGMAILDRQLFDFQKIAEANRWRKSTDPSWTSQFAKKSERGTKYMEASYGMGMIVATDIGRLATIPSSVVANIEARTSSRTTWSVHGTDENMGSGDNYWNWMIPEVGKPPVWTFMFFIVLFAAVIGPLLMWYTYRSHRQTWLLILFPIIATAVTSMLFLFAILHDGFETISRIRSFTWYDASNDTGFSWSRQSYFSGSPPREGMQIGPKTEVVPFRITTNGYSYESFRAMHSWSDTGQRYQNLLGSREQRQFLLRHPVKDIKLFAVDSNTDESGAPKITNTSKDDWIATVFVDRLGKVWLSENVPTLQAVSFAAVDKKTATAQLTLLNRNSGLEMPAGFIQGQQISIFSWMYNRYGGRWSTGIEPLMETEIAKRMTNQNELIPGSFILLMESAPHIERPMKVDKSSQGYHVVGGVW